MLSLRSRSCHALATPFHALITLVLTATVVPVSGLAQRGGIGGASYQSSAADTLPAVRLDTLLDLETVIRRALEVSPTMTGAQQGVRIAQSGNRVAVGEYVPTLSATSALLNSNVGSVPYSGLPPNAYSAGLAASTDLFTGGRRGADRDRAAADMGAAQATSISQKYAVTFMAKSAFYETLRAADLVEVARRQRRAGTAGASLRGRSRSSGHHHAFRRATGATRAHAEPPTVDWGTGYAPRRDAYALGRLVGSNGPVGGRRPESLEPRALALGDSDIVHLAVDASPAVQAAQAQQRADVASGRAARTQYVPDLRLTAGYNWANQSTLFYAIPSGVEPPTGHQLSAVQRLPARRRYYARRGGVRDLPV